MSSGFTNVLRRNWSPILLSRRFRRVNVQRPRAPHFERAKFLTLLKPQFEEDPTLHLPPSLKCRKQLQDDIKLLREENPLEQIIAREMFEDFEKSKLIAIVHKNPLPSMDEFRAKVLFKREQMKIDIYSKHTAKLALEGTRYEPVLQLFVTHNAVICCDEPNLLSLTKILKKIPQLILMAAVVEGRLLSVSQIQTCINLRDITTARGQFVTLLNNVASNVTSQLNKHQHTLLSRLKQIVEAKSN